LRCKTKQFCAQVSLVGQRLRIRSQFIVSLCKEAEPSYARRSTAVLLQMLDNAALPVQTGIPKFKRMALHQAFGGQSARAASQPVQR
jgi:hypothetical protein